METNWFKSNNILGVLPQIIWRIPRGNNLQSFQGWKDWASPLGDRSFIAPSSRTSNYINSEASSGTRGFWSDFRMFWNLPLRVPWAEPLFPRALWEDPSRSRGADVDLHICMFLGSDEIRRCIFNQSLQRGWALRGWLGWEEEMSHSEEGVGQGERGSWTKP